MKKLIIKNFRNIESNVWEPIKTTNILIGNNTIGKTSFIKAIRFALTGDIKREEIKDGAESAFVEVCLKDGTVFSREVFANPSKATKVRVNNKATTAKALAEVLERYYKVSSEDLTIVTSREINSLSSAELGTLILRFIPQKLTVSDVFKHSGILTPEQKEILGGLFPKLPAEFGLEQLDVAYEKLCEERKATKILLADKTAQSKYEGDIPATTLADIETRYKSIVAEEVAFKTSVTETTTYNVAVKKKAENDAMLKSLEKELSENTSRKPIPAIMTGYEEKEQKILKEKADAEASLKTINKNIKLFTTTLDNLVSSNCPLCDKLVCTTDKSCVKKDIEESVADNKKMAIAQENAINSYQKQLDEIIALKKEYKEQEAKYNQKIVLMNKIKFIKDNPVIIPAKPTAVTKKDFSSEKAFLEKQRREIQKYVTSLDAEKALAPMKQKLENIEVVVSQLSPKGEIRQNVIEYYTTILNEEINEVAQKMRSEYSFNFVAEDGLCLYFKSKTTAEPRLYEFLSESEKTICNFFLLNFINSLAGVKLLLLDDLNHLDVKTVEDLMTLVMSPTIQDNYTHIIFGTVSNPDIEKVISSYDIERISL